MRLAGLDLSLTGTGICTVDDGARVFKPKTVGVVRLDQILFTVLEAVNNADLVVVEGYSYASTNNAHQLGELGGLVRHGLWKHGIAYVVVQPSSLKKFGANNGNAKKADMLAAAIRGGYDGPNDDNCVDAWFLFQMGAYACGDSNRSILPVTEYRNDAIGKVDWPDVVVDA